MKKFFILGCLFLTIICVSCDDQRPEDYKREQKYIENNLEYAIHKINYEGHSYLIYDRPSRAGICHDENCECLDRK
ncbi:MAG: hypothetical protein J1F35_08275 [Erysipelotrichales bacterium]|nr:hypothetical protein [Erysipelotrichales bacterium]